MERDLKRLAHVAGQGRVVPAQQAREQGHVARARHRKQLRGPLDRAQEKRLAEREPRDGQADSVAGEPGSLRRRRARTTRYTAPTTMTAATA